MGAAGRSSPKEENLPGAKKGRHPRWLFLRARPKEIGFLQRFPKRRESKKRFRNLKHANIVRFVRRGRLRERGLLTTPWKFTSRGFNPTRFSQEQSRLLSGRMCLSIALASCRPALKTCSTNHGSSIRDIKGRRKPHPQRQGKKDCKVTDFGIWQGLRGHAFTRRAGIVRARRVPLPRGGRRRAKKVGRKRRRPYTLRACVPLYAPDGPQRPFSGKQPMSNLVQQGHRYGQFDPPRKKICYLGDPALEVRTGMVICQGCSEKDPDNRAARCDGALSKRGPASGRKKLEGPGGTRQRAPNKPADNRTGQARKPHRTRSAMEKPAHPATLMSRLGLRGRDYGPSTELASSRSTALPPNRTICGLVINPCFGVPSVFPHLEGGLLARDPGGRVGGDLPTWGGRKKLMQSSSLYGNMERSGWAELPWAPLEEPLHRASPKQGPGRRGFPRQVGEVAKAGHPGGGTAILPPRSSCWQGKNKAKSRGGRRKNLDEPDRRLWGRRFDAEKGLGGKARQTPLANWTGAGKAKKGTRWQASHKRQSIARRELRGRKAKGRCLTGPTAIPGRHRRGALSPKDPRRAKNLGTEVQAGRRKSREAIRERPRKSGRWGFMVYPGVPGPYETVLLALGRLLDYSLGSQQRKGRESSVWPKESMWASPTDAVASGVRFLVCAYGRMTERFAKYQSRTGLQCRFSEFSAVPRSSKISTRQGNHSFYWQRGTNEPTLPSGRKSTRAKKVSRAPKGADTAARKHG